MRSLDKTTVSLFFVIISMSLGIFSCTEKGEDLDLLVASLFDESSQDQSDVFAGDIIPLAIGNSWTYLLESDTGKGFFEHGSIYTEVTGDTVVGEDSMLVLTHIPVLLGDTVLTSYTIAKTNSDGYWEFERDTSVLVYQYPTVSGSAYLIDVDSARVMNANVKFSDSPAGIFQSVLYRIVSMPHGGTGFHYVAPGVGTIRSEWRYLGDASIIAQRQTLISYDVQ